MAVAHCDPKVSEEPADETLRELELEEEDLLLVGESRLDGGDFTSSGAGV